jgi:hypothetical protein
MSTEPETAATLPPVSDETLDLPAAAGPEAGHVPLVLEPPSYGEAEAQFMEWADAHFASVRADWDDRIGTEDRERHGTVWEQIARDLDAGRLACRRIAAQAVLAALPAARTGGAA